MLLAFRKPLWNLRRLFAVPQIHVEVQIHAVVVGVSHCHVFVMTWDVFFGPTVPTEYLVHRAIHFHLS